MRKTLRNCTFTSASLVILSLFQTSCTKMSNEGQALSRFTNKFANEIEREYGFELIGSGGAVPINIERIILSFQSEFTQNVDDARRLVVPITLRLMSAMNQDQNLRPYLANFPVTLKNISLTLGFLETKDPSVKDELNSVMIIGPRNLVVYNIYNDKRTMLIDFHEETFEEAQKILQEEGSLNF